MITMTIPRSRSIEEIRRDVIQCSKEEPQIPQITQIGFFVRGAAEAAPYVRPAVNVVSPAQEVAPLNSRAGFSPADVSPQQNLWNLWNLWFLFLR